MSNDPAFNFKGIDHVVLTSSDMKRTVDFYHGILGMPVLHTIEYHNDEGDLVAQHWFFGVGDPTNPNAHIAFFYYPKGYQTLPGDEAATPTKPSNPFARPCGQMMHLNLRSDPAGLRRAAEKLTELGVPYRHVTRYPSDVSEGHLGGIRIEGMRGITSRNSYHEPEEGWLMNSVYVIDPDGIEVEFNSWAPEWDNWRNDHVPVSEAAN